MRFILPLLCLLLASCATPDSFTDKPLTSHDRNTSYRVDEEADGFRVTMLYTRYQYFPESDAVAVAAKSNLLALCHAEAERRGRKILPVNEQTIRQSMGRNGVTGITSWSGTVKAFYQR